MRGDEPRTSPSGSKRRKGRTTPHVSCSQPPPAQPQCLVVPENSERRKIAKLYAKRATTMTPVGAVLQYSKHTTRTRVFRSDMSTWQVRPTDARATQLCPMNPTPPSQWSRWLLKASLPLPRAHRKRIAGRSVHVATLYLTLY